MNTTHAKLSKKIANVRISLRTLDKALRRLTPVLFAGASTRQNGARKPVVLSAKARTSLVLQGRYMGYMRQLKPRQKAQVRRIKEAQGVRVAITTARQLAQL
ncbi:MAG: hypothetical protein ACREIH_10965 [Nitrospiraceae bacterium]